MAPYHEDDVSGLIDLLGADRVLFGSDYPHAEGLAEPAEFVESLAGRTEREVRAVMRDNARSLVCPERG